VNAAVRVIGEGHDLQVVVDRELAAIAGRTRAGDPVMALTGGLHVEGHEFGERADQPGRHAHPIGSAVANRDIEAGVEDRRVHQVAGILQPRSGGRARRGRHGNQDHREGQERRNQARKFHGHGADAMTSGSRGQGRPRPAAAARRLGPRARVDSRWGSP